MPILSCKQENVSEMVNECMNICEVYMEGDPIYTLKKSAIIPRSQNTYSGSPHDANLKHLHNQ